MKKQLECFSFKYCFNIVFHLWIEIETYVFFIRSFDKYFQLYLMK